MYFNKIAFAAVAFATVQVSALVPRSVFEHFVARQSGPCDDTCAPFQTAVNTCNTTACLCTTAVATNLQECVDCAVGVSNNATVIAAAQSLVSTFSNSCASFNIPVVTVPGGSASTSASSSSTRSVNTVSSVSDPTTSFSQIVVRPSTTDPSTATAVVGGSGASDLDVGRGFLLAAGVALGVILMV